MLMQYVGPRTVLPDLGKELEDYVLPAHRIGLKYEASFRARQT